MLNGTTAALQAAGRESSHHATIEPPGETTTIVAYVAFGVGGTIMMSGFLYLIIWAFSSRNAPYRSYKWMQSVRQKEETQMLERRASRPLTDSSHGHAHGHSSNCHRPSVCSGSLRRASCMNCDHTKFENIERRYSVIHSKRRSHKSVFQESENSLRQKLGLEKFSLFDESRRNTMVTMEEDQGDTDSGTSRDNDDPSPRRMSRLEPRGSCSHDFLTVDFRPGKARMPRRGRRKCSDTSIRSDISPKSLRSDIYDNETSISEVSDVSEEITDVDVQLGLQLKTQSTTNDCTDAAGAIENTQGSDILMDPPVERQVQPGGVHIQVDILVEEGNTFFEDSSPVLSLEQNECEVTADGVALNDEYSQCTFPSMLDTIPPAGIEIRIEPCSPCDEGEPEKDESSGDI